MKKLLLLALIACTSATPQLSAYDNQKILNTLLSASANLLIYRKVGIPFGIRLGNAFAEKYIPSQGMVGLGKKLSIIGGTASLLGCGYIATTTDNYKLSFALAGISGLCFGFYTGANRFKGAIPSEFKNLTT